MDYQGITISIKPGTPSAAVFSQVFGRLDRIPVVYAQPHEVVNVDTAETTHVYSLNLSRLQPIELTRLVGHIAVRRNIMPERLRPVLLQQGVLIAAADVEVGNG